MNMWIHNTGHKEIETGFHKPLSELQVLVSELLGGDHYQCGCMWGWKDPVSCHSAHTSCFLLDLWLGHSLKSPPLLTSFCSERWLPPTPASPPSELHFRPGWWVIFFWVFKAMLQLSLGHQFWQCPHFRQACWQLQGKLILPAPCR